MALRCYDAAAMMVEILAAGVPEKRLAERLDIGTACVRKLIRRYGAGGVPNLPRWLALARLWVEAGRNLADAPMIDWESGTRVNRRPHVVTPKAIALPAWPASRRHVLADD